MVCCGESEYKGYSNIYSTTTTPSIPNQNEFVPIDGVDTPDWTVLSNDTTVLVCNNPGTWSVLVQYQMVNLIPRPIAQHIDGWFVVNDVAVVGSDATGSATGPGDKNVLVIALNQTFENGDRLQLGIRSTTDIANYNTIGCVAYQAPSGVLAPSVILSLIQTSSV
jgi:hypothetical protein